MFFFEALAVSCLIGDQMRKVLIDRLASLPRIWHVFVFSFAFSAAT